MGYRSDIEPVDADEVVRVDGVEREVVGDSDCSDQRVEGASSWLVACRGAGWRRPGRRACRGGVERDRVEVVLGLLHVGLPAARS